MKEFYPQRKAVELAVEQIRSGCTVCGFEIAGPNLPNAAAVLAAAISERLGRPVIAELIGGNKWVFAVEA